MTTRALFSATENPATGDMVKLVIGKHNHAVELDLEDLCELMQRLSGSLMYVCEAGAFTQGRAYHCQDKRIGAEGWAS